MMTALGIAALLVLMRVSAFVVFLPPFSGGMVPRTVKVGLAVCLSLIWGAQVVPETALALQHQATGNWLLLSWLAVRETLFGLSLGWLLGLVIVPMRVAGAYVVQEMGLTMGTVTSATEGSESNVVSQIFELAAVLFILGANLHHQFLRVFDVSLSAFPLGRPWELPSSDWVIGSIARTSDLGLAIIAPLGVVLFATLVGMLFIMRQTPQFNLFTFGMPLRLLVGLIGLLWLLPAIFSGMVRNLQHFTALPGL